MEALFPGDDPPAPAGKRPPLTTDPPRHRATAIERATERRLDRAAAFYAHVAPPARPQETAWRHGKWAAKRAVVRRSLERTGASSALLSNFDACGSTAVAQWSEKLQRRRLSAYYCHCRHCEPCARSKANKIAANLRDRLRDAKKNQYRLITLTLKHSDAPLQDQVKRLYACFKRLRHTKAWKSSQDGGAFMLEVKYNNTGWHPHIHAVVEGGYLDKFQLSSLWHKVTGDSFIVDLRRLDRTQDAAAYVCKYITKGTSDSVWQSDPLAMEYICATRGLRSCNTFGSWRKFPLLQPSNDPKDWQAEDSLVNLLKRSAAGDVVATHILLNLRPGYAADEEDARADDELRHDDAADLIDPPPSG
jgi:hypothetical protein